MGYDQSFKDTKHYKMAGYQFTKEADHFLNDQPLSIGFSLFTIYHLHLCSSNLQKPVLNV
jgi:hypothetical protein